MTDTAQACGNCKWFSKADGQIFGICHQPITNLMRELAQNDMVPFAFSELAATTLKPEAGKDCPTWHPKTT